MPNCAPKDPGLILTTNLETEIKSMGFPLTSKSSWDQEVGGMFHYWEIQVDQGLSVVFYIAWDMVYWSYGTLKAQMSGSSEQEFLALLKIHQSLQHPSAWDDWEILERPGR